MGKHTSKKQDAFSTDFSRKFGGNRSGSFSGYRELHKAICTECGKECEVPFKPTPGKPVYCRDCYRKKKQR